MRALLLALSLIFGVCTGASADQIPGDSTHPVLGDPQAPWRAFSGDRQAAHACLVRGDNCETLIQTGCMNAHSDLEPSPALQRRCDWAAMTTWEDEVLSLLADLRGKLGGQDLQNLNRSETAWETSMLADVGVGMDLYSGGSLAGPVGAHIRARATAQRAAYLYEIRQMASGE